jgi:subtilisin family serine protease
MATSIGVGPARSRFSGKWRHGLILLAITLLVGVILVILRFAFDTQDRFLSDVGSISAYVTAVGTLYGILAAFTIVVVWGQFNDATTAITQETTDLADLYRYVSYLDDPSSTDDFREAISTYSEAVASDEWSKMATGERSEPAHDGFEGIYRAVGAIKLDSVRDEAAWDHIIRKFEDVSDSRNKRLEVAASRMPSVIRQLFYGVSVALVAGFFMLGFSNDFLAIAATLLTTGLVVLVIDTVLDIDNPFGGQWSIAPSRFQDLRGRLTEIDQAPGRQVM